MYLPIESPLYATRTSGIYINLILSTIVSSQQRRCLPHFAPRSLQRRHFPPLPHLPDHPLSPRDLKRKGGYQALPQVLRRRPDTHPRSGDMPFMSSTPVATNPKWIPAHLARLRGRMCLADAFVGEEVCNAHPYSELHGPTLRTPNRMCSTTKRCEVLLRHQRNLHKLLPPPRPLSGGRVRFVLLILSTPLTQVPLL